LWESAEQEVAVTIQNFPSSLQPIIQQGFLEREFQHSIRAAAKYRLCARRITVNAQIGETVTQDGCKITLNHYAATTDLNVITSRVGIASQFLQNAYVNGEQAGRSLDALAGSALFRVYGNQDIIRPRQQKEVASLGIGDHLTMGLLLDGVARLRANKTPDIDGAYNCHLDPVSARQLFNDPDFKNLFKGATSTNQAFRSGMTSDFLGLRFLPSSEVSVAAHPRIAGLTVRRVLICGQDALIEGDMATMAAPDVAPADSIVSLVDDVAMVTREPVNRLNQIIAQSWYWIGGFGAPVEDGIGKRAVVVEHVG
jgi:hypothetical protein